MDEPRLVEARDRPGVLNLLRDAFESPIEPKLVERLWATNAIVAERIVDDGDIAAYAAVSEVTIGHVGDRKAFGAGFGLAPVATASRRRRQGLAAAVARASMNAAFSGSPHGLMFVLGDPVYYRRFGFMPATPFGYAWEGGEGGDAFQVMRNDGQMSPFAGAPSGSGFTWRATVFFDSAFSAFDEGR